MEPSIYSFSLYTALPLMLFFGFYFLFAKTPEKKIFKNYLRSRQIMGIAMLLLSANYSVHFFFGIRFKNADSAILMNMSTYFLCYSLFSSALIMLLDRFYITKRRVWTHIILWIIFSTLSGVVLFLLPSGIMQKISLFALAVWLIVFGIVLARRVIIAYRRAIRIFNETQADDIGTYIEWLSIFTYWAVIFGVGCGLLTFLPDKYVFIWILSSIPFYSYLFYSYQNYLLFYEQVENAFEQDIQSEEELLTDTETEPEIVSGLLNVRGVIKNLQLIDVNLYGSSGSAAGIVEQNEGQIIACSVTGKISAYGRTCGIADLNYGSITACWFDGTLKDYESGAIVRFNYNTITSCYWGGNAERGEFRNFGGTVDATKVDGATVKWQTAVDGMNIALTDNDYQWALGTDGLPVLQKKQ